VQIFRKEPDEAIDDKGLDRLTRAFRDHLEPHGYAPVKIRGARRPLFAVFEKKIRTFSDARRERRRLDRVLFGD
jgi:hypothetical protein